MEIPNMTMPKPLTALAGAIATVAAVTAFAEIPNRSAELTMGKSADPTMRGPNYFADRGTAGLEIIRHDAWDCGALSPP